MARRGEAKPWCHTTNQILTPLPAVRLARKTQQHDCKHGPGHTQHKPYLKGLHAINSKAVDHLAGPALIQNPANSRLEHHGPDHIAGIDQTGDRARKLDGDRLLTM